MVRQFLRFEGMDRGLSLELIEHVDSRQLYMCISCVMIKLDGVKTKLIQWYA